MDGGMKNYGKLVTVKQEAKRKSLRFLASPWRKAKVCWIYRKGFSKREGYTTYQPLFTLRALCWPTGLQRAHNEKSKEPRLSAMSTFQEKHLHWPDTLQIYHSEI